MIDEVNLDQTDFSNSKISTDTTTTNDYADELLNVLSVLREKMTESVVKIIIIIIIRLIKN